MHCGNRCAGVPITPSGHSQTCWSDKIYPVCGKSQLPKTEGGDFCGPYKNFRPPGNREPAIGEREWGDVPFLPSYQDPMYPVQSHPSGPTDNLYTRGPFFEGVSEMHEQFVNRGGITPRKYHEFKRHYEEPGMKNDRSITQTDFGPPFPMSPSEKNPCLKRPTGESKYVPSKSSKRYDRNAKDCKPAKGPQLICVEEEPKRDFATEYSDNYICCQKPKKKNPLLDVPLEEDERFHRYLKCTHDNCPYGVPHKCHSLQSKKKVPKCKPCLTNGSYPNGYLILPSETCSEKINLN